MMTRLVLIAVALLLGVNTHAQQNLVTNSSFENNTDCPWQLSQISIAEPWVNVGGPGSPDYFHRCGESLELPPNTLPYVGVPENICGYQEPNSGDAYAGVFVYNGPHLGELREYIQVELQEALTTGVRYEVSFHISLSDRFKYATCSFGAYVSEIPVTTNSWSALNIEPQIQSKPSIILDNKFDWIEVRDTFITRTGGEKWIVLGNFETDSSSCITLTNDTIGTEDKSYYYIDDVSVVALDSIPNSIEQQEATGLTVYPNPSSQFVEVHAQLPIHSMRLFDLRGREVFVTSNVGDRKYSLDVSGLPAGMYLLEAKDEEGRRATERIVKTDGP